MASAQKFCKSCGVETDRYKDGRCIPCRHRHSAKWEASNRDTVNAKSRRWNAKNADKKRATNARYRTVNQEKINARRKEKRAADPSIERNKSAKRRAAVGKLPKNIVEVLLVKQNGLCACCGLPLAGKYHLDHIIPVAKGGSNTEDNVHLLLPKCNQQKYTLTFEEFLRLRR